MDNRAAIVEEKRSFFRIEDLIHLNYEVIDQQDLQERTDRLDKGFTGQFMVMSSLAAITSEMSVVLRRIENDNADLATYLKALDRKIDLLGKTFMVGEVDLNDDQAVAVNLSASGIAFHSKKPLEINAAVELKMMLMPSCTGVLTYGEVVGCDPVKARGNHDYLTRVAFTHIRDEDRDVLIKHVIRRQGNMLRERRAARELR